MYHLLISDSPLFVSKYETRPASPATAQQLDSILAEVRQRV